MGDPGTKIPGSSIFGPKIVHFHVNFTFPYQNCSYHEKLRKDICTTIILLSEVSFDDEPRKFCVFATTKYEQIAKLKTLLFCELGGGSPPPLNPLLVGMVYFYIVYKYWPLV